jgi:F0F1-type ATP synthase membrane subunit b/b'
MEEMVRKVMGEMMETFTHTLKNELSDIKRNLEWSDTRLEEMEKECKEYKLKSQHLEDTLTNLNSELRKEKSKRLELELEQKKII